MKVAILIPTHEFTPFMFAYSLTNLVGYTIANLGPQVDLTLTAVPGTYVHSARQELLESALAAGQDYLLWLDSDMVFPKDSLIRLLQHREPVVGINYAKRAVPSGYVAIKKLGGARCATTAESTGLEEVDALGMGMVLMRARDLKGLPDNEWWFWFEQLPGLPGTPREQVGEDAYFFRLLREKCGLRVMLDHDLSKECGHYGGFEYSLSHAEMGAEG